MSFIKKNEIFLLEELVKKNFISKYKDSVLGIFWTILSPLLMLALFTIIFSTIFKRNIYNFPVYFLCGWCAFTFFSTSISRSMNSLKANKNILKRTPSPKYIFVLAAIISEFLNFLIMLVILICVMIVTHSPFYITTIFSVVTVFSLFILITGLGLILSVVCVYYTDVQHLWSIVSMMLMYSSAIFYPMDIVPEPFRFYMCLNPIYWVIDQFRCLVYRGVFPSFLAVLNLALISLIILVFGIIVFKKFEHKVTLKF